MNLSSNLITKEEESTTKITITDDKISATITIENGDLKRIDITHGRGGWGMYSYMSLNLEELYELRNVVDMIMLELEGY